MSIDPQCPSVRAVNWIPMDIFEGSIAALRFDINVHDRTSSFVCIVLVIVKGGFWYEGPFWPLS